MPLKQKHFILFVDDEIAIIKSLARLFRKDGYILLKASSGQEGLEILKGANQPVSLIISDQRMPGMSGAQFLEHAKAIFPDAIRLLLTGYSDMDAIIDAINNGEIHRYITKPWNDNDLRLLVYHSLEQYELLDENHRLLKLTEKQNKDLFELNNNLEAKVQQRTEVVSRKNEELEEINRKLEKSLFDTVRLLSSLVSSINPVLSKHMSHVAELSRCLAAEFELSRKKINQIEIAGLLHDIGLLGLSHEALEKDEDELDKASWEIFKQHPFIAASSLESVENLKDASEIIQYHHESFNGNGFPDGKKKDRIPLGAKIIRAASDYCHLVDNWPKDTKKILKKARKYLGSEVKEFTIKEPEKLLDQVAQKILQVGANKYYDPHVVEKLVWVLNNPDAKKKTTQQEEQSTISIKIEEIKAGMVLARDLCIEGGRILLIKGSMIKESSVSSIVKLGKLKMIKDEIIIFK